MTVYETPITARVSTPGVTVDDYHRRRPGEPVGYVPQPGDRIRYALRHSPWDGDGGRLADADTHDAQGPWSEPVDVTDVGESTVDGRRMYYCTNRRTGAYSGVDLDWWICEPVTEDGALW